MPLQSGNSNLVEFDCTTKEIIFEESYCSNASEGQDSTFITCICDGKSEDQLAIYCDGPCEKWFHASCIGLPEEQHVALSKSEEKWYCVDCLRENETFYDPFSEVYEENNVDLDDFQPLALNVDLDTVMIDDDDEDGVEFVKVVKSQTSIQRRPSLADLRQARENEKLLKFHDYIIRVTKSPIYDNDEIYKN